MIIQLETYMHFDTSVPQEAWNKFQASVARWCSWLSHLSNRHAFKGHDLVYTEGRQIEPGSSHPFFLHAPRFSLLHLFLLSCASSTTVRKKHHRLVIGYGVFSRLSDIRRHRHTSSWNTLEATATMERNGTRVLWVSPNFFVIP